MGELAKTKRHINLSDFYFCLISLLILSTPLVAQDNIKLSGRVIDNITRESIASATINIVELNRIEISDINGAYSFTNLPAGKYNFAVERIGYQSYKSTVAINENADKFLEIKLSPATLLTPSQTVIAIRNENYRTTKTANKTILYVTEESSISPEILIDNIPELELVNTQQKKILRFKGTSSNATVVMLDGRIVNSSLQSEADISGLPLNSIARVEITRGSDFDSPGLAGSINFITRSVVSQSTIKAALSKGSHGLNEIGLGLEIPLSKRLSISGDYQNASYSGNFKYVDPRGQEMIRLNNDYRSARAFARAGINSSNTSLEIKTRYFQKHAGIPGPLMQETPRAKSKIMESDLYVNIKRHFRRFLSFNLMGGTTRRRTDFVSPQTPANFIPYDSRFDETAYDTDLMAQYANQSVASNIRMNWRVESLNGIDHIRPENSLGYHRRVNNTLAWGNSVSRSIKWLIFKNIALSTSLRYEFGKISDFLSPGASLRLGFSGDPIIGIDVAAFRSRRPPNLTDLYWKEDVFATPNPDLLDEKSTGTTFGLDLKETRFGYYFLRSEVFRTNFDNIITWRRWAGDKYKPVNISKAVVEGINFSLELVPFEWPLKFRWNGTFINPLNKEPEPTHYNKYLTFRPLDSQVASIAIEMLNFEIKLSGKHIGRRYTTEENTKSMPPVDLLDFEIRYNYSLRSVKSNVSFSVNNISDAQYEMLERQPEKPREFRVTLELAR